MIELKKVSKWFPVGGGRTYVLRNINLKVKQGEFLSIMGPSGSGKSTLLNIIGMLDRFEEGEYWFHGDEVSKLK